MNTGTLTKARREIERRHTHLRLDIAQMAQDIRLAAEGIAFDTAKRKARRQAVWLQADCCVVADGGGEGRYLVARADVADMEGLRPLFTAQYRPTLAERFERAVNAF